MFMEMRGCTAKFVCHNHVCYCCYYILVVKKNSNFDLVDNVCVVFHFLRWEWVYATICWFKWKRRRFWIVIIIAPIEYFFCVNSLAWFCVFGSSTLEGVYCRPSCDYFRDRLNELTFFLVCVRLGRLSAVSFLLFRSIFHFVPFSCT